MEAQKREMEERSYLEQELSQLMERTLQLENELDAVVQVNRN